MYLGPCFQVSLEKYVCYSPLEEQASRGNSRIKDGGGYPRWSSVKELHVPNA